MFGKKRWRRGFKIFSGCTILSPPFIIMVSIEIYFSSSKKML